MTREWKIPLWILALVGLLFAAFCAWIHSLHFYDEDIDVTHDPEGRQGLVPGVVYRLPPNQEFFVYSGDACILIGQAGMGGHNPKSRSAYESNQMLWPGIIRFLGSGAKLRIEKVILHVSFEFSCLDVTGTITDGERKYPGVHWRVWRPDELIQDQGTNAEPK